MAGQDYAELQRNMWLVNQQGEKSIKITNKRVIANVLLSKALGPFFNIYLKLNAAMKTFGQILTKLHKPTEAIGLIFGGMRNNLFFLIGIIALVGAAFMAVTEHFGGSGEAVGALTGSFGELGISVDSIKEAMGLAMDALSAMFDALIAGWGQVITNLSNLGIFDSIMGAFSGLLIGAQSAFDGVMEGIGILGIGGGDLATTLTDAIDFVFGFLEGAGFFEYFDQIMITVGLFGQVVGAVFGAIVVGIAKILVNATTSGTGLNKVVMKLLGAIQIGLTVLWGAASLVLKGIQELLKGVLWFAENGISGVKDVFFTKLDAIRDKFIGWKNDLVSKLSGMWDFMMTPIEWILDKIEEIRDIDLASMVPSADDVGGFISSLNPFQGGGISSGPQSGYPVALHGTEAVVPLPDGRTIPVSLQGSGGGGGDFTANITVNSTGGNANEIARAVGREVQRAFRTRSRSGGFGRGV